MRKYFAVSMSLLVLASLMSSCGTSPVITVNNVGDLEKAIQAEKVVVVSDAGKFNGKRFREYFIDGLTLLTQDSHKRLSIMTDSEFAGSPYSFPGEKDALSDVLFVFVNVLGSEPDGYGAYTVKYLLEVKYMDQPPLLSEEITLGIGNSAIESPSSRGYELARTVFEELNTRNIL